MYHWITGTGLPPAPFWHFDFGAVGYGRPYLQATCYGLRATGYRTPTRCCRCQQRSVRAAVAPAHDVTFNMYMYFVHTLAAFLPLLRLRLLSSILPFGPFGELFSSSAGDRFSCRRPRNTRAWCFCDLLRVAHHSLSPLLTANPLNTDRPNCRNCRTVIAPSSRACFSRIAKPPRHNLPAMAPSHIAIPPRAIGAGATLGAPRSPHMATTTLRVEGMT